MKNEAELTLIVLECYSRYSLSFSIKDLYKKTKIPKKILKDILSVLEKRGYVVKTQNTDEYVLNKKIVMLI